jgi:hypothetical protein
MNCNKRGCDNANTHYCIGCLRNPQRDYSITDYFEQSNSGNETK